MPDRVQNISPQSSPAQLRVVMAGGGTGGHIFPAIAIANAIKAQRPGTEFLFVGARGKMEMEKVPQAGYAIKGLTIAGFNRSSLIKNLALPFKLIKSFFQVRNIFKTFKPHAVIGVGGYSSFPVLRYAQIQGIPTFIHESNSFGGKSNIILARRAVKVFVAAVGMERFFPANKIVVSGNPVRAGIAENNTSRAEARSFFGLNASRKTVLIIGGSLGARSINSAISKKLADFENHDLQLIWQTGKQPQFSKAGGELRQSIWIGEFIADMDKAYAAADVVVSRSGAMAVTEIMVSGKPAIFVPYPHAAEDHQTANARFLVDRNAAWMIQDGDVENKLVSMIIDLAKNEELQQTFKQNISTLAIRNADKLIAEEIVNAISERA